MSAAMTGMVPRPGDVVRIGEHAATRFAGAPVDRFRVLTAAPAPDRPGWCRLGGWNLDADPQVYERGIEVLVAELTIRPGHAWGTVR
ncbi:MAG: hypothetical protein WCA46_28175 [Actinocatenispora sp.]